MFRSTFNSLGKRLARQFHSSNCLRIDPKNVEEVKIPVPWGHIAGVWWGDRNVQPVIGLHGMQDNAGTWDTLVPLLDTPSLLSLDLPGHGMSSHVAPGLTLHYLDNILFLRYLLNKHFNLTSDLTLLGHSFGASLWFMYSALFPEEVTKLISIENAMYNMAAKLQNTVKDISKSIDGYLEIENKPMKEPQTYDELLKYTYDSRQRNFPLNESCCKILLQRGLTPIGDKFMFSGDTRLSYKYLGRLSPEFLLELSSRLKCKLLNIRSEDGIPQGEELKVCQKSLDILKKTNKHVLDLFVPGGHHVHLEQPQHVASIINKFINESEQVIKNQSTL